MSKGDERNARSILSRRVVLAGGASAAATGALLPTLIPYEAQAALTKPGGLLASPSPEGIPPFPVGDTGPTILVQLAYNPRRLTTPLRRVCGAKGDPVLGSPNNTDVGPVCNDAGADALHSTFGVGNFTNGYDVDPVTALRKKRSRDQLIRATDTWRYR